MKRNIFYFKSILAVVILLTSFPLTVSSRVVLPKILNNHMVLQQNTDILLWGKANKNKSVKISPSWSKKSFKAKADAQGNWSIKIPTTTAGGPYSITFNDGEKLILEDILLGEVWICLGQSNMEFPLKGFMNQYCDEGLETIVKANPQTSIRLFRLDKRYSDTPKKNIPCTNNWQKNSSSAIADFSAVGYWFGHYLNTTLNVPIGLIHCNWGGSTIEAWMSQKTIKNIPGYETLHISATKGQVNQRASNLYNGMLYSLENYKLAGAICYQGESNRNYPDEYTILFPTFVEQMRSNFFEAKDLPFYYVQIAPFGQNSDRNQTFLNLRIAQTKCKDLIKNSGMATITDIGDLYCIHPPKKRPVAERLAFQALAKTYKKIGFEYASPELIKANRANEKVVLTFNHSQLGLTTYSQPITNFEIAGEDKQFYPAHASIKYPKNNQAIIVLSNEKVPHPTVIRYGYKNFFKAEVFNTAGFPLGSFQKTIE